MTGRLLSDTEKRFAKTLDFKRGGGDSMRLVVVFLSAGGSTQRAGILET